LEISAVDRDEIDMIESYGRRGEREGGRRCEREGGREEE
jgi:hypothetical protein